MGPCMIRARDAVLMLEGERMPPVFWPLSSHVSSASITTRCKKLVEPIAEKYSCSSVEIGPHLRLGPISDYGSMGGDRVPYWPSYPLVSLSQTDNTIKPPVHRTGCLREIARHLHRGPPTSIRELCLDTPRSFLVVVRGQFVNDEEKTDWWPSRHRSCCRRRRIMSFGARVSA